MFIDNCNDPAYVKDTFRKARNSVRKNGKSKVPLLLDEANIHAFKIGKEKFQPLISGLFEIADDIDRDEDRERGTGGFGNTHLRIHWLIRRLTFKRCSLEERSQIFLVACQKAQTAWLVDFTSSALGDHFSKGENEKPEPSEKCLVERNSVDELRALTIRSLGSAAASGSLILSHRLAYILFRWPEIADDDGVAVKAWTNKQLDEDLSVSYLAKAFTGESWSQGMGMFGLGDRVSLRHVTASMKGLDKVIDVQKFQRRLEELDTSTSLDEVSRERVETFLKALRKDDDDSD